LLHAIQQRIFALRFRGREQVFFERHDQIAAARLSTPQSIGGAVTGDAAEPCGQVLL